MDVPFDFREKIGFPIVRFQGGEGGGGGGGHVLNLF